MKLCFHATLHSKHPVKHQCTDIYFRVSASWFAALPCSIDINNQSLVEVWARGGEGAEQKAVILWICGWTDKIIEGCSGTWMDESPSGSDRGVWMKQCSWANICKSTSRLFPQFLLSPGNEQGDKLALRVEGFVQTVHKSSINFSRFTVLVQLHVAELWNLTGFQTRDAYFGRVRLCFDLQMSDLDNPVQHGIGAVGKTQNFWQKHLYSFFKTLHRYHHSEKDARHVRLLCI